MAEINLNGLNSANSVSASQNTQPTSSTQQSSQMIPLAKNKIKEEWLAKLIAAGYTEAQVEAFLIENPKFFDLGAQEQLDAIKAYTNKSVVSSEKLDKETSVEPFVLDAKDENLSRKDLKEQKKQEILSGFDKEEFNNASIKDKQKMLALEIAKNQFMYKETPAKTQEEWDALSIDAKEDMIDNVADFMKEKKNSTFIKMLVNTIGNDKNKAAATVESLMAGIQAANSKQMSLQDYSFLKPEERIEILYEHLHNLKEAGQTNFSKAEQQFWDRTNFQVETVAFYAKQNKISLDDNKPGEIYKQMLRDGVDIVSVQHKYLQEKLNQGVELSEYEQLQNNRLEQILSSEDEASRQLRIKAMSEAFNSAEAGNTVYNKLISGDSEFADSYNNAKAKDRGKILAGALMHEFGDNKAELKSQIESSIMAAYKANDWEAAASLMELKRKKFSPKELINKDSDAVNVHATTVFGVDPESKTKESDAQALAESFEQLNDKDLAIKARISFINTQSEDLSASIASIKTKYEEVEIGNAERLGTIKKSENQLALNKVIAETHGIEARTVAVQQIKHMNADVQNEALNTQLADKNEAIVRTASGELGHFHKDNQVKAFQTVKSTAAEVSEDFAREIELNLADQIQYCHKDNQLELHKEAMNTKFDEVQVRAAENIKNYDNSIKLDALAEVHKSGNIEALKKVAENIGSYPPDVQKSEIASAIGEVVLSSEIVAENLDVRVLSGTLTAREIAQLTPKQKQQYFIGLFEKATPAQKLQMMQNFVTSNMIGAMQKKVIYTMIARSPYLKDMVESGMGKPMLEAGLPLDAVNKIVNTMKISTSGTVVQQRKELAKDSSFSTYFEDDLVEKVKEQKPSHKYATGMKDTFTPLNIDAKTRAELARNKSTMFIKS